MRPIHMLWLKRYCLAPCFYFTALRQWRQLQLPYFVHCRLQFDKFSSFVVLFPSSNSTHIAQLRAWMQPVFDKRQIKIKSIQLCQTTDLPCPVAVKTISALSFLGPQMRYVFPSNKELSVTLVSNHFISEQAFFFSTHPPHPRCSKAKETTPLSAGTCLAAALPALGWKGHWPACCDSRRGHDCSSSHHWGHGSGFGLHDEPVRTRSQCGMVQTASGAPVIRRLKENDLGVKRNSVPPLELQSTFSMLIDYELSSLHSTTRRKNESTWKQDFPLAIFHRYEMKTWLRWPYQDDWLPGASQSHRLSWSKGITLPQHY